MTYLIRYAGETESIAIRDQAIELAKEKGFRVKDIGCVEIVPKDSGICLNVYDVSGKFISNIAL